MNTERKYFRLRKFPKNDNTVISSVTRLS